MLLTIVSVFLFVLFITILHLYARWFFSQVHPRTQTTVTLTQISRPPRLHRRSTAMFGLPSPIIASLPLFVHSSSPPGDSNCVLECAICLSAFQEEEIGRKLPVCGHAFHVECIDMWLHSHSTCPICRAAILWSNRRKLENVNHIVDREHVEIDVVDPEQLEVEDAIRFPVQESPKTPNTSVEINSGPSSSSS